MRQALFSYALPLICGLAFANNAQLHADSPAIAGESSMTDCSKEFLIAYFPPVLVENSLEKFHVPKDKWEPIVKQLTASEKSIITLVEEKASKITPNPLKDPQQRQAAVKIFRETLMEIFSGVLHQNGITDEQQIKSILDDIQQQKAKKFAECLEKHRQKSPAQPSDNSKNVPHAPVEQHPSNVHAAPTAMNSDHGAYTPHDIKSGHEHSEDNLDENRPNYSDDG